MAYLFFREIRGHRRSLQQRRYDPAYQRAGSAEEPIDLDDDSDVEDDVEYVNSPNDPSSSKDSQRISYVGIPSSARGPDQFTDEQFRPVRSDITSEFPDSSLDEQAGGLASPPLDPNDGPYVPTDSSAISEVSSFHLMLLTTIIGLDSLTLTSVFRCMQRQATHVHA